MNKHSPQEAKEEWKDFLQNTDEKLSEALIKKMHEFPEGVTPDILIPKHDQTR